MLLPVLDTAPGTSLWTAWVARPQVMAPLLLLIAAYTIALVRLQRAGARRPAGWRIGSYYAGMALLIVALLGPLDVFNDTVFFLHMLQHMVLIQIAAPLIALGQPLQVVVRALPPRQSRRLAKIVAGHGTVRRWADRLLHPVPAFLLFNIVHGLWHIPTLYQAVLDNELLHDVQHLSFFITSYLCWWLIVDPMPRHRRVPIPWALGPVFLTSMAASAIGAVLTLADNVVYPRYQAPDSLWGLSGVVDQQIGGLIMWVGGGLLYFAVLLIMVGRALGSAADEPKPDDSRYQPSVH